jgi:hypothetical protein
MVAELENELFCGSTSLWFTPCHGQFYHLKMVYDRKKLINDALVHSDLIHGLLDFLALMLETVAQYNHHCP